MSLDARAQYVFKAKLAEQAERHDGAFSVARRASASVARGVSSAFNLLNSSSRARFPAWRRPPPSACDDIIARDRDGRSEWRAEGEGWVVFAPVRAIEERRVGSRRASSVERRRSRLPSSIGDDGGLISTRD